MIPSSFPQKGPKLLQEEAVLCYKMYFQPSGSKCPPVKDCYKNTCMNINPYVHCTASFLKPFLGVTPLEIWFVPSMCSSYSAWNGKGNLHIYIYIYIYIKIYDCIWIYIYIYKYYLSIYIYISIFISISIYCIYIYIYIYLYLHIYIYIYMFHICYTYMLHMMKNPPRIPFPDPPSPSLPRSQPALRYFHRCRHAAVASHDVRSGLELDRCGGTMWKP